MKIVPTRRYIILEILKLIGEKVQRLYSYIYI